MPTQLWTIEKQPEVQGSASSTSHCASGDPLRITIDHPRGSGKVSYCQDIGVRCLERRWPPSYSVRNPSKRVLLLGRRKQILGLLTTNKVDVKVSWQRVEVFSKT